MREIKFRGKSELAHQWRYGSLIMIDKHPHIVEDCDVDEDGHHITQTSDRPTWVVSETVGQYTGMKDKHGVEIYEGDVISYVKGYKRDKNNNWVDDKETIVIEFDNGVFSNSHLFSVSDSVEIIGNIHDNPELNK